MPHKTRVLILGGGFGGLYAALHLDKTIARKWWLWRTIYLMKLPRFEKKLRVALAWTLDLFFPKDLAQHVTLHESSVFSAGWKPPVSAR